jgi:Ca2+-binding RTX toxin-like protein
VLFGDSSIVDIAFQGADYLDGEDGDDELWSFGGNDALYGGGSIDLLNDGDGDDYFNDGANFLHFLIHRAKKVSQPIICI